MQSTHVQRRLPGSLVLTAALLIAVVGCQKSTRPVGDTPPPKPAEGDLEAKTAAAQDRIAKAFYTSIVPKLKKCWNQVDGKGAVRFLYTYQRAGDRWVFRQAQKHATSLDESQTEAALRCMQEAARDSTFPVHADDVTESTEGMEIYWGWPVPLPEDTTELARMTPSAPGAQEQGCPKLCRDCNMSAACDQTCSGWYGCVPNPPNGCQMDGKQSCKTGWSGSLAGVVMQ